MPERLQEDDALLRAIHEPRDTVDVLIDQKKQRLNEGMNEISAAAAAAEAGEDARGGALTSPVALRGLGTAPADREAGLRQVAQHSAAWLRRYEQAWKE